jgi:hypothetical protein
MHYLFWGIRWINLQLMIADAPRYEGKDTTTIEEPDDINELERLLGL